MNEELPKLAARIRELRTERGLSISALGRNINYDRSHISKAERGDTPPPAPLIAALDHFFNTGTELTQLRRRLEAQRLGFIAEPRREEAIPTDRRQLLGAAAAVTFAGDLSRTLHTSDVDPLTLAELEADSLQVARDYWSTPHPTMIEHVVERWTQVETLLGQRTRIATQRRLVRLAGQYSYYLGRLGYHTGDTTMARRFAILASQHAEDHGDPLLIGSIAGLRSCMAYETGAYDTAADIAATALPHADPYVRARLAVYAACGYAAAGDINAAADALDAMKTNLIRSEERPGAGIFDDGEAALWSALALSDAGNVIDADPLAIEALDRAAPDHYEARALAWTVRANAHAQHPHRADPAAAAHAGTTALTIITDWPSAAVANRARRLHHRLVIVHGPLPEVQELGRTLNGASSA